MNQDQNDTTKKKPGRPRGVKGQSITLYLTPEVVSFLRGTRCASQVVEDLVRQYELTGVSK